MTLMIGLGLTLILLLSVVAIVLWRKVWAAERIQREQQQNHLGDEARFDHIYESLYVLASSVINDQVRIAEAGIRMAILLDHLELTCEEKHLFACITEVYNRTRDMATHDERNALEKSARKQQEKELVQVETEFSEAIKKAARYIVEPAFRHGRVQH